MKTHFVMMALASAATTALIVIIACGAKQDTAPANNTPASAAQCGRDADCKGDRICDHGQCVSPR